MLKYILEQLAIQCFSVEGKIEEGIKEGFLAIDEKMRTDEEMKGDTSGATAVVVIVKGNKIYCGNVGDSRAVACITGVAKPLSFDHKPANEAESKRITAAGGWVEFNRVNGNLALSRALGDFTFKSNKEKPPEEQMVTAFPDVTVEDLTMNHEFIILACDGIWDCMSSQEVVDFCRSSLASGQEPEEVCEALLQNCLAPDGQMGGIGCDNMTAVLVCLLQGQSNEAFIERCSRPAQKVDGNFDESFVTPAVSPILNVFEESDGSSNITNDCKEVEESSSVIKNCEENENDGFFDGQDEVTRSDSKKRDVQNSVVEDEKYDGVYLTDSISDKKNSESKTSDKAVSQSESDESSLTGNFDKAF